MTKYPTGKESQSHSVTDQSDGSYISDRWLTIPNIICGIRLTGSFVLVGIAWADRSELFLWIFLLLAMSDWVDGKLAILLDQRSVLGAQLDTWADAALYTALLIGALMLFSETLRAETAWIIPLIVIYLISTAAGLWKYRRWPSYHTWAGKAGWYFAIIGTVCLFMDWSLWPLRVALTFAAITNLEGLAITIISPAWRADVTSIYHAWRDYKAG